MSDYRLYDYDDEDYGYDPDEDYDYDDDPYYDDDYDDAPWPDPAQTIGARLLRFIHRLKLRWYLWRHRDEISDIPF